jgi:hypothetical protein
MEKRDMRGRAFRIVGLFLSATALVWPWNRRVLSSRAEAAQHAVSEQTTGETSHENSPPGGCDLPDAPPPDASPPVVVLSPTPSIYDSVPKASLERSVATVNGDPISLRLFERRLARDRFSAFQHFGSTYGAKPGADFWSTPHGAETPAEWLKQQTLNECVRINIELGLAKAEGIIGSTSYAAFLQALDKENERRREALAAREPIYGPQQYREDEFFLYVTNNVRIALQRRLWQGRLHASDDTLREYYESVKDSYYDRGHSVTLWAIEIHYGGTMGYGGSRARDEAKAGIEEVKRRLDAGERFEDLAAEQNENGEVYEYVFDFESRSIDRSHRASRRDEAMALSEGETSGVFESMSAFFILKCMEKKQLGYQPFDEVKGSVQRQYVEQKYQELKAELVESASVEIDREEWDRVEVR